MVNADGAGPLVIVCDHASNMVPRALEGLGVAHADLLRHIAWDIGAASLARHLSARFDAPLVLAGFSRLVIDCNRDAADPTSIALVSEDTVIEGNRGIDAAEVARRRVAVFDPYHRAIESAIARFRGRAITPAFVAVHSFTPTYKGIARPWHVGVLWNRDPRLPVPLMRILATHDGILVGDNQPYSGKLEYGYSVRVHGEGHDLPNVLLEVRDDLIRTEEAIGRWAGLVGDALARVLAEPATFAAWRG